MKSEQRFLEFEFFLFGMEGGGVLGGVRGAFEVVLQGSLGQKGVADRLAILFVKHEKALFTAMPK